MQVASTNPNSAALMQRVDRPDNHDTRKQEAASQSIFASYAFGPMDLQRLDQKTEKRDDPTTSGVGFGKNPLSASSLSFVTSVQDVGNTETSTKP